jgi:hypothetical protein
MSKLILKSKPVFAILEAVYLTNHSRLGESIDYYLIRGHWKLEDLKVVDYSLTYKGKMVDCPHTKDGVDWEDAYDDDDEETFEDLVISEEVDELRFADIDDWEDLFEGCTLEDIDIEE